MSALGQKRTSDFYSITSLACARSAGGIVMPSALAALRLITSSYLVGAWSGVGVHLDQHIKRVHFDFGNVVSCSADRFPHDVFRDEKGGVLARSTRLRRRCFGRFSNQRLIGHPRRLECRRAAPIVRRRNRDTAMRRESTFLTGGC